MNKNEQIENSLFPLPLVATAHFPQCVRDALFLVVQTKTFSKQTFHLRYMAGPRDLYQHVDHMFKMSSFLFCHTFVGCLVTSSLLHQRTTPRRDVAHYVQHFLPQGDHGRKHDVVQRRKCQQTIDHDGSGVITVVFETDAVRRQPKQTGKGSVRICCSCSR